MPTDKEVEIVISPDGTITADQIGWEGSACHGAVDDLLKQLGKRTKTSRKQEFFKEQKVKIRQPI